MAWTQRIIHGKEILISSEDVDLINGWRWRLSLHSKSYIKRETTVNKKDISIFLHVEIAKRMWFFITCYAKNAYKLAHIPCWVRKTAFNFDVLAFGKKSSL